MKTISSMIVATTAVVLFAFLAQPSSVDAAKKCMFKEHKTNYIKNACKKGQKEAKKAMKKVAKKGDKECMDCHQSLKTYKLKSGALDELRKILAKMGEN